MFQNFESCCNLSFLKIKNNFSYIFWSHVDKHIRVMSFLLYRSWCFIYCQCYITFSFSTSLIHAVSFMTIEEYCYLGVHKWLFSYISHQLMGSQCSWHLKSQFKSKYVHLFHFVFGNLGAFFFLLVTEVFDWICLSYTMSLSAPYIKML